jgi:ABC-2 type transport system permease protein
VDREERRVNQIAAFVRMDFLTAVSYRIQTLLSFAGLALTAIPVYFIAKALQPVMAESIRGEGAEYFGFVLLGMVATEFVLAGLTTLPGAVGSGIRTGTLESLFVTPTGWPMLLVGMLGYRLVWAVARSAVLLATGWALGANLVGSRLLPAAVIIALIALAYIPFGVLLAALVLSFRTMGPGPNVILIGSTLLGGVYYPTHVIPSWIEHLSAVIPLTYGLRALRQTLLGGMSLGNVASDLGILVAFTIVLLALSGYAFHKALEYARRSGSLTLY